MKLIYAIEVGSLGTNQNDIETEFYYFYNQDDALEFQNELRDMPFSPYFVKMRVFPMYEHGDVQEAVEIYKDAC